MTTTSSDVARTLTAIHHCAGKEASAHLSPDESEGLIPRLTLEDRGWINRRITLLEASSIDPAQGSHDLNVFARPAEGRSRRYGLKESLTDCEIEIFLSLARGHCITVKDHETGALWRGWIDVTIPDQGFIWIITDVGKRKLLDIGRHTVWRPEEPEACSSVHREAGHLEDDRALTTDISPGD